MWHVVGMRLTLFVLVGTATLGAGCSSPLPGGDSPSASEEKHETIRRDLPVGELEEQILSYYGAPAERVKVVKHAAVGKTAFALVEVIGDPQERRGFAQMTRRDGEWLVETVSPDLWQQVPAAGSNRFELTGGTLEGRYALGGFVDPTVTRLETIEADGRVYDADTPTEGATVLVTRPWLQFRVYRGESLLGASLTTPQDPPGVATPIDQNGMEIAEKFMEQLLSSEWTGAAQFFAAGTPTDRVLPPLRDVLLELEGSPVPVEGEPNSLAFVAFEFEGSDALLSLTLTMERGGWRIWAYTLQNLP